MTTAPPRRTRGAEHDGLRTVLGRFATGVTVITAGRETPQGMTANSFTSVSLDPPLVLVCVARGAAVHQAIADEGAFAVSILSASQAGLARRFADHRRPRGRAQFESVDAFGGRFTGAPLISGALAWLECSLSAVHDGGDHSIVVGSVLGLSRGTPAEPLLFYGGAFRP